MPFFLGPLTVILKKNDIVPNIVTANSDFVGVRIPNNDIARKLVKYSEVPIAAPSANISGKLSGTSFDDIVNDFANCIDFAINGGNSSIGLESTIIKVVDNVIHILRPGYITADDIRNVIKNAVIEETDNYTLPSLSMKHYLLDTKSILVYSLNDKTMVDKIISLSKNYNSPTVVCCSENAHFYKNENSIKYVLPVASKNDLNNFSKNLFTILKKASSKNSDIIIIEGIKKEGLGIAIMNRLINACDNNFIEI